MIQSGLFFLLGFAGASFLALLIAPAVWRRAVFLTRKRIESSVPLTVNELQAGKDRMRAEHAVTLRKMEVKRDELLDKLAEQQPTITDLEQQVRTLKGDLAERNQELADAIATISERVDEIAERDSEIRSFQLHIDTMEADLAARTGELDSFKRMLGESEKRLATMMERFEQTNTDFAEAQADMAALHEDLSQERDALRDSRVEAKELAQLLKGEQNTVASLEKQIEKARRVQVDLEAKLDDRELEIARGRETMSIEARNLSDYERRAADAEAERAGAEQELTKLTLAYNALEKKLKELSAKGGRAGKEGKEDKEDKSGTGGNSDASDALEIKLGQALAELKKVTTERDEALGAITREAAGRDKSHAGDEELREQINQLAAEMVHLTGRLEGEGSAIDDLLADSGTGNGNVVSLADRINALRASANKAAE